MAKLQLLPRQVLLLLLLLIYLYVFKANGLGFTCATGGTCTALVGYKPLSTTTIGNIFTRFQLDSYTDLLAPNSLPSNTPSSYAIPAGQTIRVPITCRCQDGTGTSDKSPVYVVQPGDTLDYIATSIFSRLVDVKSLVAVSEANKTTPGQILRIPLPCSCDSVDGISVTHYALVVEKSDTLRSIAAGYNTTMAQLEKLNNLSSTDSLVAGRVLDVPLPLQVVNSSSRNNTNGLSPAGAGRKSLRLTVIIPITLVAVLCAAVGTYSIWRWKARKSAARERYPRETIDYGDVRNKSNGPDLPFFKLGVIMEATNSFSVSHKLGQGGFGPVYKGMLAGGEEVAIKRLSKCSKQGLEEFMNEVKLIAKLQHKNLVQLLGCCTEREERILVYEYMPNKSLDKFLFDTTLSKQLVWEKRFDIIVGVARGLQYLHQESRLKVIHRDLKAGNILLDDALNPKISDFGLARAFAGEQTQVNTHRVVGTYGYMPPEYAMEGRYSTKSDVFSFGVIVLEIVSGQRMTSFHNVEHSLNLLGHAWKLWNEERGLEFVDPLLGSSGHLGQVMRCINVGLLCVQTDAADRPAMSNIVLMLSSDSAMLPKPKQPAYSYKGKLSEASSSSIESDPRTYTATELITSVLEPR